MGKYGKQSDMGVNDYFQQCIANELAEGNRLKLIELRMKCQKFDFPDDESDIDVMIRKEELKDKA